jgi:hypothetical protein
MTNNNLSVFIVFFPMRCDNQNLGHVCAKVPQSLILLEMIFFCFHYCLHLCVITQRVVRYFFYFQVAYMNKKIEILLGPCLVSNFQIIDQSICWASLLVKIIIV